METYARVRMRSMQVLVLSILVVGSVLLGCKASNEGGAEKNEHPSGRICREEAIQIAEAEIRKLGYLKKGETLRSEAVRGELGYPKIGECEPRRRIGWVVNVTLVPLRTGGHWLVVLRDDGGVVEVVGGA
jgi:hypothetical protein